MLQELSSGVIEKLLDLFSEESEQSRNDGSHLRKHGDEEARNQEKQPNKGYRLLAERRLHVLLGGNDASQTYSKIDQTTPKAFENLLRRHAVVRQQRYFNFLQKQLYFSLCHRSTCRSSLAFASTQDSPSLFQNGARVFR